MLFLKCIKVLDNVVSSLYMMASEKSFVYIINKSGRRIEPYGMPIVMGKVSGWISSISIYCFLFVK